MQFEFQKIASKEPELTESLFDYKLIPGYREIIGCIVRELPKKIVIIPLCFKMDYMKIRTFKVYNCTVLFISYKAPV